MPLNPLRNDSTRPPDGAFGVVCEIGIFRSKANCRSGLARDAFAFAFCFFRPQIA
jgi:hypothetical protein